MANPRRQLVTERGRELGWQADHELLNQMAEQGWDPVKFDFDDNGLVIEFEQTPDGQPSKWKYDCNQEGGTNSATIGTIIGYSEINRLEMLFVYRVGTQGAERRGFYTRFFGRLPREETESWNPSFEYCGVVASTIETGSEEVEIDKPPTTHPKLWELIGTVRSWNETDYDFTGRRLRIYKRPIH
jgi:hypothetical protein